MKKQVRQSNAHVERSWAVARSISLVVVMVLVAAWGGLALAQERQPIPQHPFMAADGRSNVHNDGYMTDTYAIAGPASDRGNLTFGETGGRICITIAFDKEGSIRTLCTGADGGRGLYLMDAATLKMKASYELPSGPVGPAGSGYFYLDHSDNIVVPTINKHVFKVSVAGNPAAFRLVTDYDLTALPDPAHIVSVLPDWSGRLWFATEEGLVGILREGQPPKTFQMKHKEGQAEVNEGVFNSFAVDETGGVYIVSDHALYRFDADKEGNPVVTWREAYDRGTRQKPGQFSRGSGTTPTLMGRDYVTITDNAEPRMNVLVYKRQAGAAGSRLVCKVPVFKEGASATENSLVGFGNSIIVENNYGYTLPLKFTGKLSEPGVARIDFSPDGSYKVAWTASEVVPSVVSKYSMKNGIVYTYTKDMEGWYFTGLNGQTGARLFRKKVGNDMPRFNCHYAGLTIGPDGALYVGTIGGIVRFGK